MEKFAKLIEYKDFQVVAIKDFEENGDTTEYKIDQITMIDGNRVAVSLGYFSEEKRDKYFDEYNEISAQRFIEGVKKMFAST